jgi:hypothetical protein
MYLMKRRMLSYTTRPSLVALTMVVKLSSSSTMSLASLLTSVPVMPMAIPMSACLRAGASLTPSPGHGDKFTPLLQGLHDAELMFGGDAGVDADLGHDLLQSRRSSGGSVPDR